MDAEIWCDLIQFLVGGLNIAEPQPALRSIEVALIWEWEGLHLDRGILRQITPIEKPASEKEKGRTLLRPSRTTLIKYQIMGLEKVTTTGDTADFHFVQDFTKCRQQADHHSAKNLC
jgi:hypothetical protein